MARKEEYRPCGRVRRHGREEDVGESLEKVANSGARKILPGIHLGPSSRGVSEGLLQSLLAVTLGHSRVNDTPRSSRSSSVIYRRVMGLPASRCFRNSPLIRLRALPLSSVTACKLCLPATVPYKRPGQPASPDTGTNLPTTTNYEPHIRI